jgi:hypothetical protein
MSPAVNELYMRILHARDAVALIAAATRDTTGITSNVNGTAEIVASELDDIAEGLEKAVQS